MKKLLIALVLGALLRPAQGQEQAGKSNDTGLATEHAQSALSVMVPMALQTCNFRGTATLGLTINGFLGSGSCTSYDPTNGTLYGDFYTFNATAGHTVRVTGNSGLSYVATIQDYVTGTVIASSSTCGYVQNVCSFNYVVPVSGTYVMGVGAYGTGSYSLIVADVTPAGSPTTCTATLTNLCLNSSRFRVSVGYVTATASGSGTAVAITSDTGYFWFFSSGNIEMVVKVVDGRGLNNHFWVFAGGLTNVDTTITITDTQTGTVKTYRNPANTAFQPIQDTTAF